MATEQLEDLELLEETPPTMLTEQDPKKLSPAKKKPGPHNPDQATESEHRPIHEQNAQL